MTYTQIVAKIADRLNLTSAASLVRIGEEVNERFREVCSGCQLQTSVLTTVTAVTTIGNRSLTFDCEKILSVFNNQGFELVSLTRVGSTVTGTTATPHGYQTGSAVFIAGAVETEYNGGFSITVVDDTTFTYTVTGTPTTPATGTPTVMLQQTQWVLAEQSFQFLRNVPVSQTDPAQNYAIQNMIAGEVTIFLDSIPQAEYILSADAVINLTDLSGSQQPLFPQDFHDILIWGGLADELYKMEKYDLAEKQEQKFEKRLSELRLFIAKSAYMDIYQGKNTRNGYWFGANGLVNS